MALVINAETFLEIASQGYLKPIEDQCKLHPGWVDEPIHQDGKKPLHLAASCKQLLLVKLLLSYGANINSSDQAGNTPLHIAAKHNASGSARYLLDHGAIKDACNKARQTPLHVAVENNSLETASELIESGANVHAEGKDRVTPLHVGGQAGHFQVVAALLIGGANPNAQEKVGWTPLHLAVDNNHLEVAKLLLNYSASPNIISKWGWTPLHLAAQSGSSQMAQLLLDAGADHTLTTKDKKTAYNIAVQQEQALVLPLLMAAQRRQDTSSCSDQSPNAFGHHSFNTQSSIFNNSLLVSSIRDRQTHQDRLAYQAFLYGTPPSNNSPSFRNSAAESPASSRLGPGASCCSPSSVTSGCSFCGPEEQPAAFICPLSQKIMSDPVFTSDGYTFDRSSIEDWFESNPNMSPLTSQQLSDTRLTPNVLLRCTINDWKKSTAARKAKAAANGRER